jgi:HK97 family phage major capsid protein
MVRQANAGYMPGIVLLNPMDWFRIQITKKQTEDEYIFGSPTMPVPPALWNSAVVASPSVPEGSGMTIDPGFVTVLDREQLSVVVSNSHADFFVRNLVAILAELRAGLEVLDASAVYKFSLNTVTP